VSHSIVMRQAIGDQVIGLGSANAKRPGNFSLWRIGKLEIGDRHPNPLCLRIGYTTSVVVPW